MKRHFLRLSCFIICLYLSGCGKDNASNDSQESFVKTTNQSLKVNLSKTQITANGTDETAISVINESNIDVTAEAVIYVNNKKIDKAAFKTTVSGSYQIRAEKGSLSSAVINLIVVDNSNSVFTRKVLAEFFTGTWCGICPGTSIPLENYIDANPNIIMIGVHGPSGSNDPFQYIFDTQFRNAYNISGVPTVLLNRSTKWDGASETLNQLSLTAALAGIALETTISGNTVKVMSKVKFGTTISQPLKIIIMLVEDGLVYNQANYGHFGLANPIPNYLHRNVLRTTATDIFGDVIPTDQQTKNNIWQKSFSVNATGYDIAKCKIVVAVMYDNSKQSEKGVLNAQIVKAGMIKDFD